MLASKRGVYLSRLVWVPKRQPGVQMDLSSSELQDEIKTIVKLGPVQKIVLYEKNCKYPKNYVLKMHDKNDRDFTRYEYLYCSWSQFIFYELRLHWVIVKHSL